MAQGQLRLLRMCQTIKKNAPIPYKRNLNLTSAVIDALPLLKTDLDEHEREF